MLLRGLRAVGENTVQVSIALVRALISAVERAGGMREEFLQRARFDSELLEQGEARLSVPDYVRALEAALDTSRDPALGLHLGETAHAAMYHVVAHLVEHAHTLGEGIDMMLRYSGILAAGYEPQLVDRGSSVALRLPYLSGAHPAVRFTAEFAMTGFLRIVRQFVGPSACPEQARFAYPSPGHAHAMEYRRVFGGVERFDQRYTEMLFPRIWLATTQLYSDSTLNRLLQSHAERELAQLELGGTITARVERVLEASHVCALPTMAEVARQLDMSARTLARKLQTEGATFVQLVDDRRTSAAKCLLERRRLTIQQVADAMGFSDAPAFHRAFRRWTGLTPRQYVDSVSR